MRLEFFVEMEVRTEVFGVLPRRLTRGYLLVLC
jgi:hypothetical protein